MRDGFHRLVADAYAEKAIPEENDDLIKGIAEAAMQIRRKNGGAATAKLLSNRMRARRQLLARLIEKLKPSRRLHLSSEHTVDKLMALLKEEDWPYPVARTTLVKDLQAIKRERGSKQAITT